MGCSAGLGRLAAIGLRGICFADAHADLLDAAPVEESNFFIALVSCWLWPSLLAQQAWSQAWSGVDRSLLFDFMVRREQTDN
jgi:hypothetical protein